MKPLGLACVAILLLVSPALAGNASLTKGNSKLYLKCDDTGCFSQIYTNGKKGAKKKLGPGGHDNFVKHKKAFQAQGWT